MPPGQKNIKNMPRRVCLKNEGGIWCILILHACVLDHIRDPIANSMEDMSYYEYN